jgi:hypothetical protein
MAEKLPETIEELFPSKWIKCEDLQGRSITVRIERVDFEDIRQPDGERVQKCILAFERKSKRLILNKTMAAQLGEVCGSHRLADWIGHRVTLAPATAENGRATIAIRAAPEVVTEGVLGG